MIYELLMFFGLFNPNADKLNKSDTITAEITQEQFDKVVKIMQDNPEEKHALYKYLASININENENYKLMLRLKKQ